MKYLEEGLLINNIQNKYANEINQTKNLKYTNNKNDFSVASSRSSSPYKPFLQKSYILSNEKPLKSIEKPLKSPKRLMGANGASTRSFPLHLQIKSEKNQANTKLTNNNSNNTNSSSNGNDYSLTELVNVYNGFNHKFKNETSSIRAYKTIGHTILSFASIISMKNRPLLDNEINGKNPQQKRKELKEKQNSQQQQKNKNNSQLQNRNKSNKQNNNEKINSNNNNNKALPLLQPFSIETISSLNDNNLNNNFKEEPSQENIDQDIKVEIIRTLSICGDGSLSTESLESLKSIDYVKIEDIINEYLITPTMPEVPTRYERDNDHLNSLNHLYDAFIYFNNRNLEQYVAWIPINNNKSYLSASSLLAKKHAPFVFKKTITFPKRVSSLYTNYSQSNVKEYKSEMKTNLNQRKPQAQPNTNQNEVSTTEDRKKNKFRKNQNLSITKQQESSSKQQSPPSMNNIQTSSSKPVKSKSLHSKVAENLKPMKSEDNKEKVKQQKNKTEIKVKPKSQENKIENKIKPKKQQEKEKKSNPKYQNGMNKQKIKSKIKPKTQENGTEFKSNRSKELKNRDYPSLLSPSVSTIDNESNDQIPCKIPILSSSNIDPSNIKINKNKNIPIEFIKNKYYSIPTLDKFEFPFYHMYDAFETYGKPLLRAPRAWRQLKKNVVSIASIYSYDNQP